MGTGQFPLHKHPCMSIESDIIIWLLPMKSPKEEGFTFAR